MSINIIWNILFTESYKLGDTAKLWGCLLPLSTLGLYVYLWKPWRKTHRKLYI